MRLPPEELNDAHPRDALLQIGVDSRDARTNVAIRFAHFGAKDVRRPVDERDHPERRERQPPILGDHQDADGQQREQIAKSGDDAGGEQLVERLDVGRHARDQAPDGIAIEEDDGQALHVAEDVAAQIAHHALAEQAREDGFAVLTGERNDERQPEQDRRLPDEDIVAHRQRDVDHTLGHERPDELQQPVEHEAAERGRYEPAIGAHVRGEPAHEPGVVGFADDIVFLHRRKLSALVHGSSGVRISAALAIEVRWSHGVRRPSWPWMVHRLR